MELITAGESHGPKIVALIHGFPAGFVIDIDKINKELQRRQSGYGRGARMNIETDNVLISAGIRNNKTTGAPILFEIENKDWKNWKDRRDLPTISNPRPGHADLAGAIKYNSDDIRDILERSSARETAARVAAGALAKQFLEYFNIKVYSYVYRIGAIIIEKPPLDPREFIDKVEESEFRFPDTKYDEELKRYIDKIKKEKDTLGGYVRVIISGLPIGIGSHTHYKEKLEYRLGGALLSVQGIKGIEFGIGFKSGYLLGSLVHDSIYPNKEISKENFLKRRFTKIDNNGKPVFINPFIRKTNNAGGVEGGMSNGENIIVSAVMKPIPTLMKPLDTVNIFTKEEQKAVKERSDITAVPACSVVLENVAAFEVASLFMDRYGSDNLNQIENNFLR